MFDGKGRKVSVGNQVAGEAGLYNKVP